MTTALLVLAATGAAAEMLEVESPAVVVGGLTPDSAALRVDDCNGTTSVCWDTSSILKLSIRLSLQREVKTCVKRCRIPGIQRHAIRTDGTYEIAPPTSLACLNSGQVLVLETGTTVAARRRKTLLVPSDIAAIAICTRPGRGMAG